MTRIWRSFGVLVMAAGVLITANVLNAQSPGAVRVKANGTTVLTRTFGKVQVKVSLRTAEIPSLAPGRIDARDLAAHWACTNGRSSCLLTVELKVSVNGTVVDVPREMLIDLGDPNEIQISRQKAEIAFTVTGGDASEGYRLVAILRGDRIAGYDFFTLLDDSRPLFTVRYNQIVLN